MLPIVEDVEIDPAAMIPCPLMDFKNRYVVKACLICPGYQGLALLSEEISGVLKEKEAAIAKACSINALAEKEDRDLTDEEHQNHQALIANIKGFNDYIERYETLRWEQRYVVRCGGVVERRTKILRVVEE